MVLHTFQISRTVTPPSETVLCSTKGIYHAFNLVYRWITIMLEQLTKRQIWSITNPEYNLFLNIVNNIIKNTHTHTHTHTHIYIYIYIYLRRRIRYRLSKWTLQHEFKCCLEQFAFLQALTHLGKVCHQLFSLSTSKY